MTEQATNRRSGARHRLALHHWHVTHGGRMVEWDDWLVPAAYAAPDTEASAARNGLALMDQSAGAKISVVGPGVEVAAQALDENGAITRTRGVSVLALGGPVLACRRTPESLLLLAPTASAAVLESRLAELVHQQFIVQSEATSALTSFVLLGPLGEALLRRLTPLDVSAAALPMGQCAETSLAGVQVLLFRSPECAVPAWRICVAWDLGEYVWHQLMEAGQLWAIAPVGLECWPQLLGAAASRM